MTLGEKLVILRKKNSLSQDELASAIRVSRQTVYKWESGKSAPDANNLIALKATFGISIDNLLDENYVEEMPQKKKRPRISAEEKARIRARVLAEEGEISEEERREAKVLAAEGDAESVKEEAASIIPEEAKEKTEVVSEPGKSEKTEKEEKTEVKKEDEKKVGFFGRLFGKKQ